MDLPLVVAMVLGVVALWVALLVLLWILRPRDVAPREVMAVVPDLLRLLGDLVRDRATPADVRVIIILLGVWVLSPIDLIPEFIPVLGPLDDVIVAIVALRYLRRRLGSEVLHRRWRGSEDGFRLLSRATGG